MTAVPSYITEHVARYNAERDRRRAQEEATLARDNLMPPDRSVWGGSSHDASGYGWMIARGE